MGNQHQKIKGYRELNEEEIDLMNEAKELAEKLDVLVHKIKRHPDTDQRWASIGMTDLQKGFMSLIRSVARPTTF